MRFPARLPLVILCSVLLSTGATQASAQARAGTPQQKIEASASIFAELCGKSLPGMSGLEDKVRAIHRRLIGSTPPVDQPGVFVQGGTFVSIVGFSAATPQWRDSEGMFFCSTGVARINQSQAVNAMYEAFVKAKPSSVSLNRIEPTPRGMLAAWTVSGAKSGMVLQARRENQQGVSMRLAWKG